MTQQISFNEFVALMYPSIPLTPNHTALITAMQEGLTFSLARQNGKSAVRNWYSYYLDALQRHIKQKIRIKPRKRKGLT